MKKIFINPELLKGKKEDYNPLEDGPLESKTIEERIETIEQQQMDLYKLQQHMLDYLNEVMNAFVQKFDVDHEFDTDFEEE